MAYYDALISKWATLTGASAPSASVAAAQAALASPEPPAPADGDVSVPVWLAYHDAMNVWHQAYAALFADPAVVAKLDQINAMSIPGPDQPVQIAVAVGYLREQAVWLPIKAAAAANPAAAAVLDLYEDTRAQTLDFTLPIVTQLMGALVSTGLLTQDQADSLGALAATRTPWWASAGYTSPISASDLEAVFAQSGGQTVLV